MQRVNRINLALLPKVEYGHVWFTLDAEVTDRVRKLQRAAERIQNSIEFMWFSGSGDKTLHCGAEEAGRLREGFLRAAWVASLACPVSTLARAGRAQRILARLHAGDPGPDLGTHRKPISILLGHRE